MKANGKCRLLMGVYYMAICIVFSYAAYYLRAEGFSSWQTGVIVSVSCVIGALLQPVSGRLADSDPKWFWKTQLLAFSALALAISVLRIFVDGLIWEGVSYGLLIVLILVMMPLVNSSCFYYTDRGISVDYGIARGIILQNENISVKGKAVYLPVYMTMFIENQQIPEDLVYRIEAI